MHIDPLDKGIPAERRGRKTTDPRDGFPGQRGYRSDRQTRADNSVRLPQVAAGRSK
jgi:hypothetical protein